MTHETHETPQDGPAFWEERYRSGSLTWSGKVNDLLAAEVEPLTPGRALDLGCGTGGDAIWLAARGWSVTAVDIAQAALDRAAVHATDAGVRERIAFERHDLDASFPAGVFDLVSACYLQSPVAFRRLAALRAAAPGGSLVVVSHETTPSGAHRDAATYMPTAPDLHHDLAPDASEWELVKAEPVSRVRTIDGSERRYRDNVLHLRRRR